MRIRKKQAETTSADITTTATIGNTINKYDQYLIFAAHYMATGDLDIASRQVGCKDSQMANAIAKKWREYSLPTPQANDGALLAQLEERLPISKLVEIIADSAEKATNNQIADKILILYLERERTRTREKYSQMGVDQRFDHIKDDMEYIAAIERAIAMEHIDERLIGNLSYWQRTGRKYGNEMLLEVKSLIDKALTIPENVDKRELGPDDEDEGLA